MHGKIVYRKENINSTDLKINTESFECGVYFIKIAENETVVYFNKVIVIK
jgi:hypothetical protein